MEEQRYRVIARLEVGGMAEVFRGEGLSRELAGQPVALKRVLPSLAHNERFVRMFLDEARLGVRLNHPNIVRIFDVGAAGGSYFLVMEFIDGVDLKTLLEQLHKQKRRPGVREALFIVMEVCSALSYAHELRDERGEHLHIVHRDISPPNVMLTKSGHVKLADFGLAKATTQLEATDPGVVKGKFGYLSPEAALGRDVDARADLFSVGIILWEALAGKRLFLGETDYQTVKNVQKAEIPSLRALRSEVDLELEWLLRKMLAKEREERFQSAGEMRDAIAAYLRERELTVSASDVSHMVRYAVTRREREARRARSSEAAERSSGDRELESGVLSFTPLSSITRTGMETVPPAPTEDNQGWFSLRWLSERLSPSLPMLAQPPRPFGPQAQWLAMRAGDPKQALAVLSEVDARFASRRAAACSWSRGIDCALGKASPRGVYFTPEQDGQVLAVGYAPRTHGLEELREVLGGLSEKLQCRVCLLGSATGSSVTFAVAERGELVRAYIHADGKTEVDFGERLPEERSSEFRYLEELESKLSEEERASIGERQLLSLAGKLSIDPSRLGSPPYTHPGVGLLVR